MYFVEVVPLSQKLPQKQLSYLSKERFQIGDVVCAPLRTQKIDVLIIGVYDVREKRQELKSFASPLRYLCEEKERRNPFSLPYREALLSFSQLNGISITELIQATSPKKLWGKRVEQKEKSDRKKSFSYHFTQGEKEKRIESITKHIHNAFREGNSTLLIVPKKEKRTFLFSKMKNLFGKEHVFLIDGNTAEKKRGKILNAIQEKPSLVLSTSFFLDIPLYHKKNLILEDVYSDAYISVRNKVNTREFALHYAKYAGFHLFCSDIFSDWRTKRMEADINRKSIEGKGGAFLKKLQFIPYHEAKRELNDKERIEEILRKKNEESFLFNPKFEQLIIEAVKKKKRIFLYAQKKHFASRFICLDCGSVIAEDSFRLARDGEKIHFIHKENGEIKHAPDFCPSCSSWRLKPIGVGSERIYYALKKLLPKEEIFLIDANHGTKKTWNSLADELSKKESFILVGTKQVFPFLSQLKIEKIFIPSLDIHFFLRDPEQEEHYLYDLAIISQYSDEVILQTRLFRKNITTQSSNRGEIKKEREGKNELLSKRIQKLLAMRRERLSYTQEGGTENKENYSQALPLWKLLEGKESFSNYIDSLERKRGKSFPIALFSSPEKTPPHSLLNSIQQSNLPFSFLVMRNGKLIIFAKDWKWREHFPKLVKLFEKSSLPYTLRFF